MRKTVWLPILTFDYRPLSSIKSPSISADFCDLWALIRLVKHLPHAIPTTKSCLAGDSFALQQLPWTWHYRCFNVSFLTSISVPTVILTLGKVEFFKWINLRNILFIGLVKFKIKQWFSAYQDQFCAWFSLTRLPTKIAWEFLLDHFLKETALSFFFLLLKPVQCLGMTFLYIIFCLVT